MPINKNFVNKFQRLVEYKVYERDDVGPTFYKENETIIREEDPTPLPETIPTEDVPQETISSMGVETTEDNKLTKKTEILKDLAKNHSDKIEEMLNTMENLETEFAELREKTQEIELLKNNFDLLKKQVDFLTPPTPEESLEKMVRISGGQTIDDYWKNYLAKQGKTLDGNLPYYANGNLSNEKAKIVDINFSEDDIKKSLGLGSF